MKTNVDPSQFETRRLDEESLAEGLNDLHTRGYDVWKIYKGRAPENGPVYYMVIGVLNLDRWKDPAQMKMALGES